MKCLKENATGLNISYLESRFSHKNHFIVGLEEGEILVRIRYVPIELYTKVQTSPLAPFIAITDSVEPLLSFGVAEVIISKDQNFKTGDLIESILPLAEYSILRAGNARLLCSVPLTATSDKVLRLSGITMNLESMEVYYGGMLIELTRKEFLLLKILMENPEKAFSRDELLDQVWGYDCYPVTRTVDNHILHLRKKIADHLFETVRGVGYRLVPNKQEVAVSYSKPT